MERRREMGEGDLSCILGDPYVYWGGGNQFWRRLIRGPEGGRVSGE